MAKRGGGRPPKDQGVTGKQIKTPELALTEGKRVSSEEILGGSAESTKDKGTLTPSSTVSPPQLYPSPVNMEQKSAIGDYTTATVVVQKMGVLTEFEP